MGNPLHIFIGANMLLLAMSVFIFCRNWWVYRQRLWVLHEAAPTPRERLALYSALPSYDQMMWTFWVWDIRAFLPAGRQALTPSPKEPTHAE